MLDLSSTMATAGSRSSDGKDGLPDAAVTWRPSIAWGWILAIAALRLLVHLLSNGQYGFHRDELVVWSDSRSLAWGYVAYPPVTPFLGRLGTLIAGDSLTGFRLFATLTQVGATIVCALIAREFGGRRAAQILAALAFTAMPISMLQGNILMYSGVEFAWLTVIMWMVARLCNTGDARWWLGIGAMIGLSLLTRYTTLVWSLALVAATMFTPMRRQFLTRWPWLGALLVLVIVSPSVLWQWHHDFVAITFTKQIHARDIAIGRTDNFLSNQIGVAGPTQVFLWVTGFVWLIVARGASRWRMFSWIYVIALLIMTIVHGRDYYMSPGYPALFAAGAVAWEAGLDKLRGARRASYLSVTAVLMTITLAMKVIVMLPVWPVNSAVWNFSRKTHNDFAEEIGWPELAQEASRIYKAIPANERATTAIFTNNYGEAGALDRYGPALGLPQPISGIDGYWYRGYGPFEPKTVIIFGADKDDIASTPADCEVAGHVTNAFGVSNEETSHPDVYVCRNLRFEWSKVWPSLHHFG